MNRFFLLFHKKLFLVHEAHCYYQNWRDKVKVVPHIFPVVKEVVSNLRKLLLEEVERKESEKYVEYTD